MVRAFLVCALSLIALLPCTGKEAVYLKSGFTLEVDSHTQDEQTLLLHLGDGTLQFPADQVLRIEPVPDHCPVKPQTASVSAQSGQRDVLGEAALVQGLEPEFVRSVAKIESGLRQNVVSPKGALGLMQLMPATAAELGVDPSHPADNAQGGAKYLRDLLILYRGDSALALAAYNAGPATVAKFGGIPPYAETRQYVAKVIREYQRQKKTQPAPSAASAKPGASKPIATN